MSTSESNTTNIFIKTFAGLLSLLVVFALAAGLFRLVKGEDESNEVSWLYSQTAESGEIDDLGGGRYHIVMRDVDFHTIQFSDRPDRLVEIIDTADLVKQWDTLFATSSPNAVLVEHEPDGRTDSIVVVLEKPHFDYAADELTYEAQILADELHPERLKKLANAHTDPPVAMRAISLFIDSVVTGDEVGEPIFTGPFADALKSQLGLSDIPTKPLDIGSGVRVNSVETQTNADGVVTGNAIVGFASNSFTLNMKWELRDKSNWSLKVVNGSTAIWSPPGVPGLTIDPSSFIGGITSANGAVTFALTGGTHSWQVATGATYVSTLSFNSACPLVAQKCPDSVKGPFISMNGTLTIAGFPNAIALQGAMNTNAEWARFDGMAGNLVFDGYGVTNTTLTMWRGTRTDSFDQNMNLPSLAKLASGNNLEFCGGFTLDIPKVGNKATDGCVRWSPSGVVIGQVGVDGEVQGTLPSTNADQSTSSDATAQVMGVAWTNLSAGSIENLPSQDVVMSGVGVPIAEETVVLAGKASLPGVVADALNVDLGSAAKVVVDVRGSVSATGFSMSGDINTSINISEEPFKLTVRKVTAALVVDKVAGVSFSVGTAGNATLGYAPDTRTLTTAVQLVAATKPQMGMSLSVNVRGTAASTDVGRDGLTISTRLQSPQDAEYVWPNAFGVKGLNLWNMTVQIAFQNDSPALGYTSTSYIDPMGEQTRNVLKCDGPCGGEDWMVGTFGINVSLTNPCLAYSVGGSSGTSTFQLDGGVVKASSFAVGVAPNGCSIQSGDTLQELPKGFAGFKFIGLIGNATIEVATEVSVNGFEFHGKIANLTLAGMKYSLLELDIEIDSEGSDVFFEADMQSQMGSMQVATEFITSKSQLVQKIDATMTDWAWAKKGTVDLDRLAFSSSAVIPTNGSCAKFAASASGVIKLGSRTLDLKGAQIALSCARIESLYFDVEYDHKIKWNGVNARATLKFVYPMKSFIGTYFFASASFSYERHFSKSYEGKTFSRDVSVEFMMSLQVDPKAPQNSVFKFEGDFEADRVSGKIGGKIDAGGKDFTVGGELRLNPSWAGVYHFDWGEM